MQKLIAIAIVGVAMPAVAEPQDVQPSVSSPSYPSVSVDTGVLERSDGSQAVGIGLSLGTVSRGPYGAQLRLMRWTGVEGSSEQTWQLATRVVASLPSYAGGRLRPHFFLGSGLERTQSSGGDAPDGRAMPSFTGTALSFEVGFGAELRLSEHLRLYDDLALGRRTWLSTSVPTPPRDDTYMSATIGLAASSAY